MKTIFDLCTPRPEVLEGSLSEDIFAARLKDVMDGTADPIYGDAHKFFENTYPTSGLRTLLGDALGRLVGDASGKNAIIRLETAFGGGKTHNLIALYHCVKGDAPADIISQFLPAKTILPKSNQIKHIAGVVGSDLDPMIGIHHPEDKVTTFTLWGEIAYQLGGRSGYALIQESDQKKVAPGTGIFEILIGDAPALIMLDEIARHLRAAVAVSVETGQSTLADQTIAFLMSLLEFASSKERCQVVLTLAGETDAFSSETDELRQKLTEALSISARQERVLTPTTEGEIYAIVTHRLFKHVDRHAAKTTLDAYSRYYLAQTEKGADLPPRCLRAEYLQEMIEAYPFHPELLSTLNRKTATIPNFNQTRGALRLLAWTVRTLWERKAPGIWSIHPHHLDFANAQIVEDLTSRLDRPRFKQVVEADIFSAMLGSVAHAWEIDQPLMAAGKPPYARRLGITIFLNSLTQGIASGVDPADLLLAVLEPHERDGDDPAIVNRALEQLANQAWFLEYDGHRYRFKTEPSINKIIADEMVQVGPSKAKQELENRIRQIWKKGFLEPFCFRNEPNEIDDDAGAPKLVILHFDALHVNSTDKGTPDLVRHLYEHKGADESFRRFQNNLLFLVADEEQSENMVTVARRYLAIGRILGDAERMAAFNKEQKDKLKNERDTAELNVRIAITKAYRYLYYPSADAPKADAFLKRETLPAQEQGDVDKDQTNVVLRVLRALKKVQTADDEALPALYVKSKALDLNQTSLTTEELRQAFARKIGLRMLLDIGQLRKTIQNGVQAKVWIYYDAVEEFGYDHESPPPSFKISEETILYLPDEAKKLGIRIKGKWKPTGDGPGSEEPLCPVCGRPESQCICGVIGGPGKGPTKVSGDGVPTQAFQQILDQCQENGIERLNRLYLTIDGIGRQVGASVRAIGLGIPQFGKGTFGIELDVKATFGQGDGRESFTQVFSGGWERYKRLKPTVDAFMQEADDLKARIRVACIFENGLEIPGQQFDSLRDVLITLEVGRILVEAIPQSKEA